jgi:IclR family transcriptional regulator, acetate operon repressor
MNGEPRSTAPGLIEKSLRLLAAITDDGARRAVTTIARDIDLPQATAYRIVSELVDSGMLVRLERGRYLPGLRLVEIARRFEPQEILTRLAAPVVARIARQFRQDAHLAAMEGGMVTYLIKAGAGDAAGFARQGMQLEAYCSGVGKVLLAHLPPEDLSEYLANGPFIRLTPRTMVDPDDLRDHLARVRDRGYALDNEEIAEGLRCLAVPVRNHRGEVIAALSLSGRARVMTARRLVAIRAALNGAAARIHVAAGASVGTR